MSVVRRYSLFYNFSSLGLLQVANFLLSLLVIPYVLRITGAEGFGVIAVAQVLMFYFSVIADYGFNRTAIREVALYKEDRERISRVFFTVLFSKLLLCATLFILLLGLVAVVPLFHAHDDVYVLAFSFVLGQAVLVNWFFQGMEKMLVVALLSLFGRILFVVGVFLFLRTPGDLGLYIFFMGAGNFIAGILSIYIVMRVYKLQYIPPSPKDIWAELKEGWPVTTTNLSMTTIQYVGIFILRLFTTDTVVGLYSIAERIYFAMKLMLDVFSQVAYPRVCRLLLEGRRAVMHFFRTLFLPFFGIVVTGSLGIFLMAPYIIHFLLGHDAPGSVYLLRWLCVAVIVVCANIPACLLLLAGDHKKNYLFVFTAGMVLNIVANALLAPWLQATGTVIATLVTECIITAGLYWQLYRLYRKGRKNNAGLQTVV